MDRVAVHQLSGLSPIARFAGRIQRQIHVRSVGAAWRVLRDPARSRARQLPQLFSASCPLAVFRATTGTGSMNTMQPCGIEDDDRQPPMNGLLEIAQRGLGLKPKRLPSWLFYDERGSALFEQICEQPEYYLTRREIALMDEHAGSIADSLGSDVRLVEYGSGNARKTRMLLQHLHSPVAYVPVELSTEPLRRSVDQLAVEFPRLPLQP